MPVLIKLFISFALIGLGAYGGGLVTIPLIQHELVASRHWLEFGEMAQLLAIAQITPGPIAINAATFAGFRLGGVPGAIIATSAVVSPSLLILGLLLPWIEKFGKKQYGNKFETSIQLGVLSLIFFAVWSYGVGAIKNWLDLMLAAFALLLLITFEGRWHPITVILLCGMIGIFFF